MMTDRQLRRHVTGYRRSTPPLSATELLAAAIVCFTLGAGLLLVWFAVGWLPW